MIGCLRTRVRKQPIIALNFEPENELKFYNLDTNPDEVQIVRWYCKIFFEKVKF